MNKLFKHTFIYAFGTQISRFIGIFILPFVTPYLTSKDYGINGLALAYISSFVALKDLGFISIISNAFYRYPLKYCFLWNKIFSFLSLWAVPLSFFIGIVLYVVLPLQSVDKLFIIVCTCLPIIFFDNYILFGSRYLQLSEKPIHFVFIVTISGISTILITYVSIVHWKLGYKGWFIANFLNQLISFICYKVISLKFSLVKFDFSFNYRWISRHLKKSLPAIPHTYSSFLMETSDRIVLSLFFINLNLIGVYNIGYTFGQYFNILNMGLSFATSAFYLKLYNNFTKESEIMIRNVTLLIGGILLAIATLSGLWMKELFSILIKNAELKEGYSITIVILFSYVGNIFYMSSGNKLIAFGKLNQLWKVSLFAGVLNVVLNLILIPFFNIWGSVVATLLGNSYLHYRIYFMKYYKDNSYNVNFYPLASFSTILFFLCLTFLLKDISIVMKSLISTIVLAYLIFLYFKKGNKIQGALKIYAR